MSREAATPLPDLLMRSAFLLLATLFSGAVSVSAQHGGHAGGGGFHGGGGGFHSSGGMASHATSAPMRSFARPNSFARPSGSTPGFRTGGMRSGGIRPVGPAHFMGRGGQSSELRYGPNQRRPEYAGRGADYGANHPYHPGDPRRPHRPVYNYGYGGSTLYTGGIWPYGYPYGYGDLGFAYGDDYDTSYDDSGTGSAYDANPAYDESNTYVAQAPEAPEPPSPDAYYGGGFYHYGTTPAAAPPLPQESITLVFNNGVPSQQIHNYILTGNTLTVLDGRSRVIPIATLDLAATDKANRAAGVDFQLSGTR